MLNFDELGLSEPVLAAVREFGWEKPTPIQAQAIPWCLEGRDMIGASQTGTGKTAAFGLPVLSRLERKQHPQCLILEPTRELAAQVLDAFREMGKFTDHRALLLHGGVSYGEQNDGLQRGDNIIVATPGRLLDHVSRRNVSLRNIEVVILDETDRMLDMGFLPDVRKIVEMCPRERQTMMFSATMPPQIEGLAKWALKDPLEIEIGARRSIPDTVNHAFYPVSIDQRDELLLELLRRTDFSSVMVFTRTKREADKLHDIVRKETDHTVAVMHGDIPQKHRERALAGFRDGTFDIIIATDVAARGLDISSVSHVINYRVPENAEDYVHRIGRTGRAEKEGDAFTLLSADEEDFAKSIERFVEKTIEKRRLDNFDYVYTAMLEDKPPVPVRQKRRGPKRRKRS